MVEVVDKFGMSLFSNECNEEPKSKAHTHMIFFPDKRLGHNRWTEKLIMTGQIGKIGEGNSTRWGLL